MWITNHSFLEAEPTSGNSSKLKNSEVSSNWNLAARNSPRTAQKSKKQHPPSQLHRNARCLVSFIEKKQAAQETCTQEIRKDTKCETIISKPVELTATDEVESTMLNLTPARHAQETQDDKSWKTYKLTSTASESHQVMDTPLTYSDAKANSEDTSGSLKNFLEEAHDVTFVTKDDSPGLSIWKMDYRNGFPFKFSSLIATK